MVKQHPYLAEITRALMVLALFMLTLANHSVAAVAHDDFGFTVGTSVNCGDLGAPHQVDHSPCHACRIGSGALLPLPPCEGEPAYLHFLPLTYSATPPKAQDDLHQTANRSRGPPLRA